MNPALSEPEVDTCLEVLYRGLVEIRTAAEGGDSARASAIADALHNLPHLLSKRGNGWTLAEFRELFLAPLVESYPDLVGLKEWLDHLPETGR